MMAGNPACEVFIPMLSPYVDGELSPRERGGVERHLAACRDCAGRAADLRAESGLIRVGMEMAADEVDFSGFSQKVLARLTPHRLPLLERLRISLSELLRHRRGMLGSALAATAAALVAGVWGPGLLRGEPPPGYASQRLVLHSVSTDESAHVSPVVLTAENGDAIIWLVDHDHVNGEPSAPADDGGSHDEDEEENVRSRRPAVVAPGQESGRQRGLHQGRPNGGEL